MTGHKVSLALVRVGFFSIVCVMVVELAGRVGWIDLHLGGVASAVLIATPILFTLLSVRIGLTFPVPKGPDRAALVADKQDWIDDTVARLVKQYGVDALKLHVPDAVLLLVDDFVLVCGFFDGASERLLAQSGIAFGELPTVVVDRANGSELLGRLTGMISPIERFCTLHNKNLESAVVMIGRNRSSVRILTDTVARHRVTGVAALRVEEVASLLESGSKSSESAPGTYYGESLARFLLEGSPVVARSEGDSRERFGVRTGSGTQIESRVN